MPKMDEGTLKAILAAEITGSVGETGSTMVQSRLRALRYYRGEQFGNEQEGRSKVVSRDVAEAIDQTMPSLIKIFMSGEEIVRFNPRIAGPMDDAAIQNRVQQAEQATDYCNWVWRAANEGYRTTVSWLHDGLLYKTGIIKIWWDDTEYVTRERYTGLNDAQVDLLLTDDTVELAEMTERDDPAAAMARLIPGAQTPIGPDGMPAPGPKLYDIVVSRTNKGGSVKVAPVPLDEFLIRHRTVNIEKAPFTCHRYAETVSKLIERFPDHADDIKSLPSDETEMSQERTERFRDEDGIAYLDAGTLDPSRRLVWVAESFIQVDYDGDGISEMRSIISAGIGQGAELILQNDEVDDNPFAPASPYLEPHRFWGRSLADQTEDIQLIKSTLLRGALDTVYNANTPQLAVDTSNGRVNLDDLLMRRVGGLVRTLGPPGESIMAIPTQPVAADAYQMIALMDNVREQRTGIRRFAQGPGADALQNAYTDTATGANLVENSSQERIDYIARNFAETGFKRAMKLILKLESEHRTEPRVVQLRGKWVAIDPREWDTEMDMSISVGLGTGNRQQQMAGLGFMLNIDKEIIQAQGGLNGPILGWPQLYAVLEKMCQYQGLGGAGPYYMDPANAPPGGLPPKPNPEMEKAQQEMQLSQARAQSDMQLKQAAAEYDRQDDERRLQAELMAQKQRGDLDMQIAQQRAQLDMQLEQRKAEHRQQLELMEQSHQAALAMHAATVAAGQPADPMALSQ